MVRQYSAFDSATNLAVIGPLTPEAIGRIPGGFRQWAFSPGSAAFRFARGPSGWRAVRRASLDDAVSASILRVAPDAGVAELESIARALDYERFGVVLLVSSRFIAVSFAHRMSDGVGALAALEQILSGRLADEPRMSRVPSLRALRATRQMRLSALRAGREYLRAGHEAVAAAPLSDPSLPTDGSTVRIAQFAVTARRLGELAAAERATLTDGTSVPTTAVLIGLLFRSIRSTQPRDLDLPLQMLVGLRRYLGTGWSTRGNFALAAVLGTTRDRPWTATDYRDSVAPRLNSADALPAYVLHELIHLRSRLGRKRPAAGPAGSALLLSLSLITGRIGLGPEDYLADEQPADTMLMLTRGTILGPHATIVATGSRFVITVIDDSATLDIGGLEAAFRAEEAALLGGVDSLHDSAAGSHHL